MLTVQLFGRFRAQCNGNPLQGLNARKAQELFCYLLLHQDREHSRESLASLLWGDTTTSQSKSYLRKALWQLQVALKPFTQLEDVELLYVDHDWVKLNITSNVKIDVAIFEEAITSVNGLHGIQLSGFQVDALRNALDLYQENLLEGWYQDWCIHERDRFQQMCVTLLDKLMDYCEAHNEYEIAIDYGKRILSSDPFRESTHQRLMRLYCLHGDRTEALHLYDRYVAELAEEFDANPGSSIRSLYEQIRRGQLVEHSSAIPEIPETPDQLPMVNRLVIVTEALRHLQYLQESLKQIQNQLQQEVYLIGSNLGDPSQKYQD